MLKPIQMHYNTRKLTEYSTTQETYEMQLNI